MSFWFTRGIADVFAPDLVQGRMHMDAALGSVQMDTAEDLALDSDSLLAVASLSPDAMVIAPESVAPDLLVELEDSIPPESEVAPKHKSSPLDSEMVPESLEFVPDSMAPKDDSSTLDSGMVPQSLEFVPDSMAPELEHALPPGAFVCARCHVIHENREAWNRAHSRFWPCSRCGLVHLEYMVLAQAH